MVNINDNYDNYVLSKFDYVKDLILQIVEILCVTDAMLASTFLISLCVVRQLSKPFKVYPKAHLGPCQTSKMDCFAKIYTVTAFSH